MDLTNRFTRTFLGALTLGAALVPIAAAAADVPPDLAPTPTTIPEPCPPELPMLEAGASLGHPECPVDPDPCPPPLATCEPCFPGPDGECPPPECPPDGCIVVCIEEVCPPEEPDPDPDPDPVDEPDPSVPGNPTFTG
jgi:hypothetical protein